MVAVIFVLFLYAGGQAIEYTPKEGLSDCLSMKRKIERVSGRSKNFDERWVCKKVKVKLEKDYNGNLFIEKVIEGD